MIPGLESAPEYDRSMILTLFRGDSGSGSGSFVQIAIPILDPEISGIITALDGRVICKNVPRKSVSPPSAFSYSAAPGLLYAKSDFASWVAG